MLVLNQFQFAVRLLLLLLKIYEQVKTSDRVDGKECVRAGAAGARTRRSLRHHLLHPLILRLLVLCAPADFETQSSLL